MVLPAGLALLITLLLYTLAWRAEEARIGAALARTSAELGLALEKALQRNIIDLQTLAAFIESKEMIDRDQVRNFARLLSNSPGAHSRTLAWLPRTKHGTDKTRKEAGTDSAPVRLRIIENTPGNMLVVAGEPERSVPLYQLKPKLKDEALADFDVLSSPSGRNLLRQALLSDRLIALGPLFLSGHQQRRPDILLLLAVPRSGAHGETGTGAQPLLAGLVLAALNIGEIIEESFFDPAPAALHLRIYDDSLPAESRLLYSDGPQPRAEGDGSSASELQYVRTLQLADRQWRIVCLPSRPFLGAVGTILPEAILGGGLLATVLLAFYLNMTAERFRKCRQELEAISAEAARRHRERDACRRHAEQLSALNRSAHTLVEMLPHGAATCDSSGIVTYSNPFYNRMLGLDEGDAQGMPVWALAANERERNEIRDYLEGLGRNRRKPEPRCFHLRAENGELREFRFDWASLANTGKSPAGFALVLTDISSREKAQETIDRHRREYEWQLQEKTRGLEELRCILQGAGPYGDDGAAASRPEPEQTAALRAQNQQEQKSAQGKRILVVEDNPVNLQVAEAMLEELGAGSEAACNGWEALERLHAADYDLVLMDCQMPGMDGYAATRELRRRETAEGAKRHIPIIAMTAHAFEGDRERCLAAGMDDYISKPFSMAQLREVLQRWLPAAAPNRADAGRCRITAQSSPSASSAGGPVLEREILEKLKALEAKGGKPILAKIITLYLDDAPRLLETLEKAALGGRDAEAAAAAHALKSSSANVGAKRLSLLCRELENKAGSGEKGEVAELAAEILAEYSLVRDALETEKRR